MMYGWHRGLLRVLGGVGGLVIAFMLARKLSATLIPFLLQLLPPGEAAGTASAWQTVLAQLFYSNSLLGRIVELILFILLFGIITWLIHFLVGFTTRVLEFNPAWFRQSFLCFRSLVSWRWPSCYRPCLFGWCPLLLQGKPAVFGWCFPTCLLRRNIYYLLSKKLVCGAGPWCKIHRNCQICSCQLVNAAGGIV